VTTCSQRGCRMAKVIVDSNFLFIPFQFRVDVFEQLNSLLGKCEPVVLSTTLNELESLTLRGSERIRRLASAALELADRCRMAEAERELGESSDDVILRMAQEWKCIVATNDSKLRRRLRGLGIPTVFLRQMSRLDIEGYVP